MTYVAVQQRSTTLALVAFALFTGLVSACKNPIHAALDEALDFDGLYTASDGTIVELHENFAVILTAGSGSSTAGLRVGDLYFTDVRRTGGYMPATIKR